MANDDFDLEFDDMPGGANPSDEESKPEQQKNTKSAASTASQTTDVATDKKPLPVKGIIGVVLVVVLGYGAWVMGTPPPTASGTPAQSSPQTVSPQTRQAAASNPNGAYNTPSQPAGSNTSQTAPPQHLTTPQDEVLKEQYYQSRFDEDPDFEVPVKIKEVILPAPEPRYSHSETECLGRMDKAGEFMEDAEHDYCMEKLKRRVERLKSLQDLTILDLPLEESVDMRRPVIKVNIQNKTEPQIITSPALQPKVQTKPEPTIKPQKVEIDHKNLYSLIRIVGDTAILRGNNTGSIYRLERGDRLAYDGRLAQVSRDEVTLQWGEERHTISLWDTKSW